ncbi:ABC transporter permease [Bacteroides sp.]
MIKLYLKQAWQLLKQNKLFSAVYILGTGLGIALTMTLVIIYYVKMAPVYPEGNRNRMLVCKGVCMESRKSDNMSSSDASYKMVKQFYYPLKKAEAVSAVYDRVDASFIEIPENKELKEVHLKLTDSDFWKVFTFSFVSGKPFTKADLDAGLRVAVISRSLSHSLFGNADAVGKNFLLDANEYRVTGVVQDVSFITPATYADVWLPYTTDASAMEIDEKNGDGMLGDFYVYMLAPSVLAMDEVTDEVCETVRKYNFSQDKYLMKIYGQPVPYWKSIFYEYSNAAPDWNELLRKYGIILFALLFVPALNLAGMISSRMTRQLSELGIRKAFGASKRELIKQIFWENMLLTSLGGVLGLLLSYIIVYLGRNWLPALFDSFPGMVPDGIDTFFTPGMLFNPTVIAVTFVFCLLLNVLSAIFPALYALRKSIVYSINEKK